MPSLAGLETMLHCSIKFILQVNCKGVRSQTISACCATTIITASYLGQSLLGWNTRGAEARPKLQSTLLGPEYVSVSGILDQV